MRNMTVHPAWLRRSRFVPLSVVAVALVACAAQEDGSDNGPVYYPGASGSGTGGTGGSAAGTGSGLPAAGTGVTPSAGTTSVGTGGKPAGTGGTGAGGTGTGVAGTATTGGTPAAGGTAAGTCPQYTGTLAKDSVFADGGFGKSTTGMWSGYGYTYKYGTATIAPGMGTSCFAAKKFCANGSVPADDKSGAGLGWNISQMMGSPTQTKVAIATPVTIKFAGVPSGSRIQLSASATVSYCYTLTDAEITAGSATIPYASFKTECWGTTGMAYDGAVQIEAIQVAVPGSTAGTAKMFDFCVLDVEPM